MSNNPRETIFISKATPGDDAFVLWLAPRLEAAGYTVFADVLGRAGGNGLRPGDRWRAKLTDMLQNGAIKMLLCCTTETLRRRGVQEEIGIAEDLAGELDDPNFIIPLRLEPFKKVFGIGELQYIDFHRRWASGLVELVDRLVELEVPRSKNTDLSMEWLNARAYYGTRARQEPEVLTSNWLRIDALPDDLQFLEAKGPISAKQLQKVVNTSQFPCVAHGGGLLSFASGVDLDSEGSHNHAFEIIESKDLMEFIDVGHEARAIEQREARNLTMNLLRQAWEKQCLSKGLSPYAFSKGTAFHVGDDLLDIGKRISWGRQGERRSSMLRNHSRGKLWEYGVEAIPSLYPFPHYKLRGRVRFSERLDGKASKIITDKRAQFRLRRSVCSGWRNNRWHGCLMAFLELISGESPLIALRAGAGQFVELDGMPVQATSPVTARQTSKQDEDYEEEDRSTLQGYLEEDGEAAIEEEEIR